MFKFSKGFGFTLIELMISVGIIGIVVAVALPMYNQHIQTTRRTEATIALQDLAAKMERYHTMNNTYATVANPAALDVSNTTNYTLSIPVKTANTFTIQATPITGSTQASDGCGNFTLTQAGVIGVSGSVSANDCWKR